MGTLASDLRQGLDPAQFLRAAGLEPEPWQEELLRQRPQRALLCCCRQAGKSTAAAAAVCHEAIFRPGSLALMFSPSQRQSSELLRRARELLIASGSSHLATSESNQALELANGSRIVALPGRDETIRGYSGVTLLVIDEAAFVPDGLYTAVRPMLGTSEGRLLALSTPNGQRGWFYRAWESGGNDWHRTKQVATDCPRITDQFLAQERREMTAAEYAREYECTFADAVDAVFFMGDVRAAINPNLPPLFPGGW